MRQTKKPLEGEQLDAAIKALIPGKELWIEPGIYVRRNKDSSLSYFVRIYYNNKKHEFWEGIKDHLSARACHINLQLEIAKCKDRNECWQPASEKTATSATIQAEGLTLRQWAEVWYEEIVLQTNAKGTQRKYRGYLDTHIYPVLGRLSLVSIKHTHLQQLVHVLRAKPVPRGTGKLSWKTAHVILRMLAGCFHCAKDRGLIPVVPFPSRLTKLLGRKETTHVRKTWTREQVERFFAGVLRYDPEWYPILMTFFQTGCRLGEILALRRCHLDFTKKRIKIEETYSEGNFGLPKNKRVSEIDMTDELALVLQAYLLRRDKEEKIRGYTFAFLFGWQQNSPIAPTSLRDRFKKLTRFLGLPQIRIHDIRHTVAEMLLTDGVSSIYVRDQLRHSNESTTTGIYGDIINHRVKHVNRLNKKQGSSLAGQESLSHKSPAKDMGSPESHWPVGPLLPSRDGIDFRQAVHQYEQQLIRTALTLAKGSRSTAAALLMLPRATFLTKLCHLGRSMKSRNHKPGDEDGKGLFNSTDSSHGTAA